ncbi:hypothetical protein L7F22_027656 [Adiantum nelumboides]|nr:hypothetical protein [Adiantum nelumboides]
MTDVRRIIRMRDDKQALAVLLQKGSIGDETMARFGMAEKELEAEILDVVSEANTFKEGWGQLIFPSASEMVAHLKHKEVYYDIHKQRAEETKKLVDAGKPVPQSRVPLPPLVTPAGTSITIGTPPQQGSSGSNTPLKVNAPQTNGTTAAAKAAAGSGKAATTVEEAADDDQADEREGSAASAKTNGEAATSRREASAASSSNQTISSLGDDDGAEDEEAQGAKGQQVGDGGPSLVDANQSNGQQGGANRAARRRANKNKGKK